MKHWDDVLAYLRNEINRNRGASTRLAIATRTAVSYHDIIGLIVRLVPVNQPISFFDTRLADCAYMNAHCAQDTLVLARTLVPADLAPSNSPKDSACYCIIWKPGDPLENAIIFYPRSLFSSLSSD